MTFLAKATIWNESRGAQVKIHQCMRRVENRQTTVIPIV